MTQSGYVPVPRCVGAEEVEVPLRFVSMQQLVSDFMADIERLKEE